LRLGKLVELLFEFVTVARVVWPATMGRGRPMEAEDESEKTRDKAVRAHGMRHLISSDLEVPSYW